MDSYVEGSVLVVEDDRGICSMVRDVLEPKGLSVLHAASRTEAEEHLHAAPVDLVLLDLGPPETARLDMLLEIVGSTDIPVIVIGDGTGPDESVVWLELGADDYVSKPVSSRELLARINVALRRGRHRPVSHPLTFDGLRLDEVSREVTADGRAVALTAREFDLLAFLAHAPRQVFTRNQLLHLVWKSSDEWQDDNTVAEHVYRLRRKLDPGRRDRWIQTVRGVGYRFVSTP